MRFVRGGDSVNVNGNTVITVLVIILLFVVILAVLNGVSV